MFGHHKRRREKKKIKSQRKDLERERKELSESTPERQKEQDQYDASQIESKTQQSRETREAGQQRGRKYSEEFMARPVQGLDPAKRKALQYEANKGIERSMEGADRKLLGDQSTRGIMGKSGVAYAQQRDLQKMGNEARAGVDRDITKLDSDQQLKNKAAMFAMEQGEGAQSQLDRQMAIDEMEHANEQKRQKNFENRFYQQFTRV